MILMQQNIEQQKNNHNQKNLQYYIIKTKIQHRVQNRIMSNKQITQNQFKHNENKVQHKASKSYRHYNRKIICTHITITISTHIAIETDIHDATSQQNIHNIRKYNCNNIMYTT